MNNKWLDIKRINLIFPEKQVWRHPNCVDRDLVVLRLAEPVGFGVYYHHEIVAPPYILRRFDDNNYLELLIHNQN